MSFLTVKLFSLLFLLPNPGLRAEGRGNQTPAYEVYKFMLGFVEADEFLKVKRALNHIEPVLADREGGFDLLKEEILSSIESGDKVELRRRIRQLIYTDILTSFSDMRNGEEMPITELKRSLKITYLKYLLFSKGNSQSQFFRNQKIRKLFQGIYQDLSPAVYSLSMPREHIFAAIKRIEHLEGELKAAYPEFGEYAKRNKKD